MKYLILLSLALTVSTLHDYNIEGGYKVSGKYVYKYEAILKPATIEELKNHESYLHINATIELHFMPEYEVIFMITDHNIFQVIRDPTYMPKPVETKNYWGAEMEKYITKAMKFGYRDGMVQKIWSDPEDPTWSVNMKKGIINMLHVDITGKDKETGMKYMFTKPEICVFGICETTYTFEDYAIWNERNEKRKIGMNITKAVNYKNCTEQKFDTSNTIIQGKNEFTDKNPLNTLSTIKYGILGTEHNFKLEEVTANGLHTFFPFSKKEGGITATTWQQLRLMKQYGSLKKSYMFNHLTKDCGRLILNIPPSDKVETTPEFIKTDWNNMVNFLLKTLTKFVQYVPTTEGTDGKTKFAPEMSDLFLTVVNNLRVCNEECHINLWDKCQQDPLLKKWLIHAFTLCNSDECFTFLQRKLKELTDEQVDDFFHSLSFHGKPTTFMIENMKNLCDTEMIKTKPTLKLQCYITTSNIIQSYYKTCKVCNTWMDEWIMKALEKINECTTKICEPYDDMPAQIVLSLAENLGRPSFMPYLEKIILNEKLPTDIRFKAVLCCKPIIMRAPNRVRILMLRVFRDLKYDIELRQLAFSVMMENPTSLMIQICTRHLVREPSIYVKKFVLEVYQHVAKNRRQSDFKYGTDIIKTCRVCLKMLIMTPITSSNIGTYLTGDLRFILHSWRYRVGAILCMEKMNTPDSMVIPRFHHSKLNITIFGRRINIIDTQLRIEGLQEVLTKLISTEEHNSKKRPIFADIDDKVGVKEKSDETLKIFSQLKIFDKITHVNYHTVNSNSNYDDLVFKFALFQAAKLEQEIKNGKKWSFFKPLMPVDVVYRIPTLVGVPLTFNLTTIVLPHIQSEIKGQVKPGMFSIRGLLAQNQESAEVTGTKYLNTITEVRGGMYFRTPFVEVGARMRMLMNASAVVKVKAMFDFKTKEFKHEIEMPKEVHELFYINNTAYFYIKPKPHTNHGKTDLLKIRKMPIEMNELDDIIIVNFTKPCNGCRFEEWHLKTTTGKYLAVQNNKITLTTTPAETFKVTFHGRHRRIVTLSVDKKGFVVMSPKTTCLFVKKDVKMFGKYFVLDFVNVNTIRIKTLAHFNKDIIPKEWKDEKLVNTEFVEIKMYENLFMKEMVKLKEEDKLEKEEMEMRPELMTFRLTYLSVYENRICVTPKKNDALKIRIHRETTVEEMLRTQSYKHGNCYGNAWGLKTCMHGYYPRRLFKDILYTPFEFRSVIYPDKKRPLKSIESVWKTVTDTENVKIYEEKVLLKGTGKSITTFITLDKKNNKVKYDIIPTCKHLLKFQKFCFEETTKPDNFSLTMSIHPECKINHLKIDILAAKHLPRHWLSLRMKYTTKKMPKFWQHALQMIRKTFVVPRLFKTCTTHHNTGTTDCTQTSHTTKTDLTQTSYTTKTDLTRTSYLDLHLTKNDTVLMKIRTPNHAWIYKDITLPIYTTTFPKGSIGYPLMFKLFNKLLPRCHHQNTTFITFDKVEYNHDIPGKCEHILMRSCSNNMIKFMVLLKKPYETEEKETLKRNVIIYVENYHVEIQPQEKYTMKPRCYVNKHEITFNQKYEVTDNKGDVIFTFYWEPETKNMFFSYNKLGLVVKLTDSWKVQAQISELYSNKVCGLCGNFDGERVNEFLTPERQPICDCRRPKIYHSQCKRFEHRIFADSWMVPGETCRDECKWTREHVQSESNTKETKFCLTKFKVRRCIKECNPKRYETIKVPMICVPVNQRTMLMNKLKHGHQMKHTEEYLADYKLPYECSCPCENKGYDKHYSESFFDFGLW